MKPSDLARVIVDSTVQPKNITFPTDAKPMNTAREKLVKLASVWNCANPTSGSASSNSSSTNAMLMPVSSTAPSGLYASSGPMGQVISDIARKIDGNHWLEARFARLLALARRVRDQERGQRGPKEYSLHAPEVECQGKPHKATSSRQGEHRHHAQALQGRSVCRSSAQRRLPSGWPHPHSAIEDLVGNTLERLHADAGYRGHNAPPDYKLKAHTSKQKRRVTPQIKREMRRHSAFGHIKNGHRVDRNYLRHRHGDANNAVLAAAGYNFRLSSGG